MAGLPTTARVVIIGGGVVGASSLYHLCKAGWTDCVLLEKNELTSGSTWHAAGNVPTFSSSWSLMNMQRYSTELYGELGLKDARAVLRSGNVVFRTSRADRVALARSLQEAIAERFCVGRKALRPAKLITFEAIGENREVLSFKPLANSRQFLATDLQTGAILKRERGL